MTRWFCGLLLSLLAVAPAWAAEGEPIGRIRNVEGQAWIVRDGSAMPAAVDAALFRGDVLRTGWSGAAVGILMNDETSVSLGPRSELALLDYTFTPKEGKFALVMRMAKGTFSYLAGKIGKLAPETIQLQLPEATIAVRGTKLLITVEE